MLAFLLVACSVAPAPAETFLTEAEALRLAFPGADRIEKVLVALTSEERAAIGTKIAPRDPPRVFKRWVGFKADAILGYAVIDDALGKSEPITYMVAVDASLRVSRVEILAYRESHGGEVRMESWRQQFAGKDAGSPLRIGSDIRNIAGATISCRSLTEGVRYQLACLSVLLAPKVQAAETSPSIPAQPGSEKPGRVRRVRLAMGTTLAITIEGLAPSAAQAAIDGAFSEVDRLDSMLSTFRPESEVSSLNRASGGEARPASPEVLEILGKSLSWSQRTQGAFDVTVGPLVELWRRAAESGTLPADSDVEQARSRVGYRSVELDLPRSRVRLAKPGAGLDFGGIGKGYALDRAAAVLERAGASRALLDFGGQFLALEAPPGEAGWRVELRDPARPGATAGEILLVRASVSTSADYERGLVVAGRRVSHILDPRTGLPVEGWLGATVVSASATDADALSTALFVMDRAAAERFASEQGLAAWLVPVVGEPVETHSFRALRRSTTEAR